MATHEELWKELMTNPQFFDQFEYLSEGQTTQFTVRNDGTVMDMNGQKWAVREQQFPQNTVCNIRLVPRHPIGLRPTGTNAELRAKVETLRTDLATVNTDLANVSKEWQQALRNLDAARADAAKLREVLGEVRTAVRPAFAYFGEQSDGKTCEIYVNLKEAIQRIDALLVAPVAAGAAQGAVQDMCDCPDCGGEGLVGRDGSTCGCIIAGCRKRHGRDAYLPPRKAAAHPLPDAAPPAAPTVHPRPRACGKCGGSGEMDSGLRVPNDPYATLTICNVCHGTGMETVQPPAAQPAPTGEKMKERNESSPGMTPMLPLRRNEFLQVVDIYGNKLRCIPLGDVVKPEAFVALGELGKGF